ncbi:acyl-homoserine-lactone synthase [Allorhizobium undicola]|uniref:acyl-homoserine-lactone synthase n=1 Tax=Allorhizobium undicola TaxID=78527 RepID=UPI000481EFD7|nr:acyl-homoserine-lactone synthase [Allorhizobium undicola]
MLKIINMTNKADNQAEMAAMFRLRKRVFHDLLRWDVTLRDDMEIDAFDNANPLYLLCIEPATGKLQGSLRLLPTLGPNMLADTFPVLLGEGGEIRSAAIWESSRFCIDPDISLDRSSNQITLTAAELMCGVGEMGLASGLSHIVTVTDVFLERMFRRMGCPGQRIAAPCRIGSVDAVALAWEVSETLLATMKQVARIEGKLLPAALSLDAAQRAA